MARTIFSTFAFVCSALVVLAHVSGNNLGDRRKEFKSFLDEVKDVNVVFSHKDIETRVEILKTMISISKGINEEQGKAADALLMAVKSLEAEKQGYAKFVKAVEEKAKAPTDELKIKDYETARDAYPALYKSLTKELVTAKNGISNIFIYKTAKFELKEAALQGIYALERLHKYKQSLSLVKSVIKYSGKYVNDVRDYYTWRAESFEDKINEVIPELTEAVKIGEAHELGFVDLEKALEPMADIDAAMKKVNCLLYFNKYSATKKFYEIDGKNDSHHIVKVIDFITTHTVAEDRKELVKGVCQAAINGFSASSVASVFGVAAALALVSL